jgi:hypothetical protein
MKKFLYVSPEHKVDCESDPNFSQKSDSLFSYWGELDDAFKTCSECGAQAKKYVFVEYVKEKIADKVKIKVERAYDLMTVSASLDDSSFVFTYRGCNPQEAVEQFKTFLAKLGVDDE